MSPSGPGVGADRHQAVASATTPDDLHVVVHDGPPGAPLVVLVHGSMDRSAGMSRVARHLPGCTVVRYDRRGYARSRRARPARRFDDHVDDLVAVLDGRPAVVLGHSYGGVITLAAAAGAPELVTGAVVFEPPLSWLPWYPQGTAGAAVIAGAADPEEAAERFLRRMIGDSRWERLPARTRAERRSEGPALVAELRFLREGPAPFDPADVACPVIAACGSEARGHHRQGVAWLAEHVADGRAVELEGAHHGAHLTHAAALAHLVQQVLPAGGPTRPSP